MSEDRTVECGHEEENISAPTHLHVPNCTCIYRCFGEVDSKSKNLTFPSAVTAKSVCSPPISWMGRRLARESQLIGSLTFAPSTPPS